MRERIIKGAKELFQVYGFRKVSMDEISKKLGISKRTIYRYFPSKERLIEEVIDAMMKPVVRKVLSSLEETKTLPRFFSLWLREISKVVSELTPPMLDDLRNMPDLWEKIEEKRCRVIRRIVSFMKEGQERGEIRSDISFEFMGRFLFHLIVQFVNPNAIAEFEVTPPDMLKNVLSIFMEGVLTEEGRKGFREG